jgi:two-component system LytT family response regulator
MDQPIRAIIVDDELQAVENLTGLLSGCSRIQIAETIVDAARAVERIEEIQPGLLFMDIQMPGKSGFDIVTELHLDGFKPDIIFVTAFDEYAIKAIRYAAFDFLVKPVVKEELVHAINRLFLKQQEKDREEQIKRLREKTGASKKLKISTAGGFTMINPADILYILADWNYAEIYLDGETKEMVTTNLGSLEEALPATDFFRISRSVIINTSYLTKVSRKKRMAFLIKDGKEYSFKIPLLNIRKLERFLE